MIRQTRIQIDAAAITQNLQLLKSWTGKDAFFCPMVKANGYGHGEVLVARIAEKSGTATALGVALYEEGVELRLAGIHAPILVFAPVNSGAVRLARDHRLTPVAGRFEDLELLAQDSLAVHLKFNTGMNRLGFDHSDLAPLKDFLKKHPELKVEGVCTHLSHGEEAHEVDGFTQRQLARFREMSEGFPGVRHAHKSASLVALHENSKPIGAEIGSRPGISLYGLPQNGNKTGKGLKPALKWITELIRFHNVAKGEAVGYGARWIAPRASVIGIVPVGYGDGYLRALSNKAEMLYRGARVPVVGSVCMDYTLIDLTAQAGHDMPLAGEEIVILGKQGDNAEISAGELADKAGTIAYEIVTAISRRVPREVI
jgi:alanine racemase